MEQQYEPRAGWLPETLSPHEQAAAIELAATLASDDAVAVTRFGTDIQEEIAAFATAVLDQIRARDAGDVGELMTELTLRVREMPLAANQPDKERHRTILASIPAVNRLMTRMRRGTLQSRTVEEQIELISAKLDEAYCAMQRDIELLEQMLIRNHAYFKKLELHMAAAQLRLTDAVEQDLPAWSRKAKEGQDPWAAQRLADCQAFTKRLEMRLDDLRRTRYLSLMQAPKIRLLQQSAQLMMEKIQSMLYNLIPIWKLDLVTSIAEQRTSRALALHNQVRSSIEDGMKAGAERTRRLTVEAAAASEGGMIGIDAMRSVHDALAGALEDTMRIYAEGRTQREAAERERAQMENELKRAIAALAER